MLGTSQYDLRYAQDENAEPYDRISLIRSLKNSPPIATKDDRGAVSKQVLNYELVF